jgi:hypothetical protein
VTTSNASVGGAIKTVIEQAGLGLAAYRDQPAARAPLAYCVVNDEVAAITLLHGDASDPYRDEAVRREVQVDLWQSKRDPVTGTMVERYDLAERLMFVLHGSLLPTAPSHVFGCRVTGRTRLADPDTNLVHHVIAMEVDHRSIVSEATQPTPAGGQPDYLTDLAQAVPADC